MILHDSSVVVSCVVSLQTVTGFMGEWERLPRRDSFLAAADRGMAAPPTLLRSLAPQQKKKREHGSRTPYVDCLRFHTNLPNVVMRCGPALLGKIGVRRGSFLRMADGTYADGSSVLQASACWEHYTEHR